MNPSSIQFVASSDFNPYWNVAVENYLVAQPDSGSVTLYLWRNRRTVVVGQNQNPFSECNVDALLADGGYVMRRTTGGGAVYHDDGNINFSFVAPYGLYDQERHFRVIARSLRAFGLEVEVSGRNDLLCQGRKFSGNAFSKGRSQRLHHGTILIKTDMGDLSRYLKVKPAKLMKHGVKSVESRVVNLSQLAPLTADLLAPRLLAAFEEEYGMKAQTLDFERLRSLPEVDDLYRKFSSDDWLFGRWRHFQATRTAQFEWGVVELSLQIDESRGLITSAQLATDALDPHLPETVSRLLTGASIHQSPTLPQADTQETIPLQDILSLIY